MHPAISWQKKVLNTEDLKWAHSFSTFATLNSLNLLGHVHGTDPSWFPKAILYGELSTSSPYHTPLLQGCRQTWHESGSHWPQQLGRCCKTALGDRLLLQESVGLMGGSPHFCKRRDSRRKYGQQHLLLCQAPPRTLQKHCHSRVGLFSYNCCCNRKWWAFKHIVCTDWCLLLLLFYSKMEEKKKENIMELWSNDRISFAHQIPEHLLDEFILIKYMPSFSTEDES